MRKEILFLITTFVVLVNLSLVPAHDENMTYKFMIGTGFLSEFGKVISIAENGDTIEILGEGMFNTHPLPKTISGNGTIIHRDKEGNIIGTGIWHAVKLISFKSYGSGASQGLPSDFEGGRALMKIHIVLLTGPLAGSPGFEGTLRVDCTIGDKIPKMAKEGVRLAVRAGKINFNKEVSGATLFIKD